MSLADVFRLGLSGLASAKMLPPRHGTAQPANNQRSIAMCRNARCLSLFHSPALSTSTSTWWPPHAFKWMHSPLTVINRMSRLMEALPLVYTAVTVGGLECQPPSPQRDDHNLLLIFGTHCVFCYRLSISNQQPLLTTPGHRDGGEAPPLVQGHHLRCRSCGKPAVATTCRPWPLRCRLATLRRTSPPLT